VSTFSRRAWGEARSNSRRCRRTPAGGPPQPFTKRGPPPVEGDFRSRHAALSSPPPGEQLRGRTGKSLLRIVSGGPCSPPARGHASTAGERKPRFWAGAARSTTSRVRRGDASRTQLTLLFGPRTAARAGRKGRSPLISRFAGAGRDRAIDGGWAPPERVFAVAAAPRPARQDRYTETEGGFLIPLPQKKPSDRPV